MNSPGNRSEHLEGRVVYQGPTKTGLPVLIRFLSSNDVEAMRTYINTLSKERTFILFQGEQNSHEDEQKFVESMLDGIKKGTIVYLLAFHHNLLIAASQIEMREKAQRHVGIFGISVGKEYRQQGVGRLLMRTVFQEAKIHLPQMKVCELSVFATNDVAKRMYEAFGFQEYGRLPQGVRHRETFVDEVCMVKRM